MSQDTRILWVMIALLVVAVFGLGLTSLALHRRVGDLQVALSRGAPSQPAAVAKQTSVPRRAPRPGANLVARLGEFAERSSMSAVELEKVQEIMSRVYDRTEVMSADFKEGKLAPEEMWEAVRAARSAAELELVDVLGAKGFAELKAFLSAPANKAQARAQLGLPGANP